MYTLRIDEEQRKALLEAVKLRERVDIGEDPLMYWEDMLEELPEAEASSPGIIHGFCL